MLRSDINYKIIMVYLPLPSGKQTCFFYTCHPLGSDILLMFQFWQVMFMYTNWEVSIRMCPVTHWSTQVQCLFLKIQTQILQVKQSDAKLYTYQ
jgi:hypothetical protein